jgi:hypothetical protein
MPIFKIRFRTRRIKGTLTSAVKLEAIGETHARQRFETYAKSNIKKKAIILTVEEEK